MLPKSIYKSASIITRTPMRITLGGGGTDVFWYSSLRGGTWISAAIDKYVYIKIKPSETATFINKGVNKIILACLKFVKTANRININISSDVSPQSGLGGSGALTVGLLHALNIYNNNKFTKVALAKDAVYVEIDRLRNSVGPQDQYITALGGLKYFRLDKNGKVTFEQLRISSETLKLLEKNLLYFDTGLTHDTEKILSDEKNKVDKGVSSDVIKTLDKIKSIGLKAKEYLLSGELDKFGKTFHDHWLVKKSLSKKVSSPTIDKWYNEAIKAGSLGGKIMGAGAGGWFVFYVNKNHAAFTKHMGKKGLRRQEAKFDWEGTKLLKNN